MPDVLWTFTPRELNIYARQKRIEMNERKISDRYETAIICSYLHNSSGFAKTAKSPQDVYKGMEIKSIDEQDEEVELMGEKRTYKGSMKSRFEQHTAWLESQKPKD